MKLRDMELPLRKSYGLQKIPMIGFVMFFVFLILTVVPLRYPSARVMRYAAGTSTPAKSSSELAPRDDPDHAATSVRGVGDHEKCDLFTGDWVPNPEAPYYTNRTCWAIHEHQNCMKYGRPDSGFMKWRWKPDGCDLPVLDPYEFLELVRGKSMAFVGDSVARNHMQSLVCLLSRVEFPIDASYTPDDYFRRWNYSTYNFTLAAFWSPFLVKVEDATGPLHKLYLDEFDEKWTSRIEGFDYVIISAGHWFSRPAIYHEHGRIVGCRFCQVSNITDLPKTYGYRKAFRTSFRALNSLKNYKGITFVRTLAPHHFEDGEYNNGGDCVRKSPFKRNEIALEGDNLEFYKVQVEEYRAIERLGKRKGMKFLLIDTTRVMLLRPDGHPSRYGHWPNANVTMYNDCVHWCLPGPVDTWSDFLLRMLKMEG